MLPSKKRVFKEKIVQLYISIIKKEEPCLTIDSKISNFWDEFFLLKANGNALEAELKKIENTAGTKEVINLLFSRCIICIQESMAIQDSQSTLRILNSLITLSSLTHFVLRGMKQTAHEQVDVLIGNDNFASTFEGFVACTCDLLFSDIHTGIKAIVLRLLLLYTSADCDINKNVFLDHLMSDQLFDALFHLLNSRQHDGFNILLLLVVFLNFKKRSINNPFVMKLSILDNEMILSGYSQTICNELVHFNRKFDCLCADSRSGIFSTLSNMVGNIFSSDDNSVDLSAVMGKKSTLVRIKIVLVAFYEAILLNRNFISLLTTSLPEMFAIPAGGSVSPDSGYLSSLQPANLLVAFLEFTSVIMLDTKDETTLQITRLCFIILTCITEDSCANSTIHDMNLSFVVNFHLRPMRHRKVLSGKSKGRRALSHAILDLMVEYIYSHMNRNMFRQELFLLCLAIIQRLLSFEKRCRVRIVYSWDELWSSLTSLLKFLTSNENYFLRHQVDIFAICQSVINLVNIFVMMGDNFLASTTHYDELYYEIIRNFAVFDSLNSLALRHLTKESNLTLKESATRLTNSLINVKAIAAHFNAKIDDWSAQNQIVTLSEEQVLEVVRTNFDSLTLKVQDNIDQFEPYEPTKRNEIDFLASLLNTIMDDYAIKRLTVGLEEQQLLVQQIQTHSALNSAQPGTRVAERAAVDFSPATLP